MQYNSIIHYSDQTDLICLLICILEVVFMTIAVEAVEKIVYCVYVMKTIMQQIIIM
jgi:hypothetical protein